MKAGVAIFAPILVTGGTQRHLQQLLGHLDRRRFEPIVYALKSGGEVAEELGTTGVRVRVVPVGARFLSVGTIRALVRLARELRATGVTVVHGYQWRPALVGAVAARLARVPVVLASKRSLSGESRAERRAWRVLGRLTDAIVVNAVAIRDEAVHHGVRARWVVVRNGIDLERFAVGADRTAGAKSSLDLDPTRVVIGAVGRLDPRKGHDDLLRAVAVIRQRAAVATPQVVVVGDGPEQAALVGLARALGVEPDVRFVGRVADVRPWLAAMDVFVLPSREEGSSNAALEAMACARAVVATSVGGTEELIEHGRTGLVVPPRDPSALASALEEVIRSPDLARALGTAARATVEAEWGLERMVREIECLYDERLGRRGGSDVTGLGEARTA